MCTNTPQALPQGKPALAFVHWQMLCSAKCLPHCAGVVSRLTQALLLTQEKTSEGLSLLTGVLQKQGWALSSPWHLCLCSLWWVQKLGRLARPWRILESGCKESTMSQSGGRAAAGHQIRLCKEFCGTGEVGAGH